MTNSQPIRVDPAAVTQAARRLVETVRSGLVEPAKPGAARGRPR